MVKMSNLITIDDLLGKAKELKEVEKAKGYVKVKGYGKSIEIGKISVKEWADIMDGSAVDKDAELVYSACLALHDSHLIERLGCRNNPVDVVRKVFDNATVFHLANAIFEFSGLKTGLAEDHIEKVVEEIKN